MNPLKTYYKKKKAIFETSNITTEEKFNINFSNWLDYLHTCTRTAKKEKKNFLQVPINKQNNFFNK